MKRHAIKNTYMRYGEIPLESYLVLGESASMAELTEKFAEVEADAKVLREGLSEAGIAAVANGEAYIYGLPHGLLKVACRVTAFTGCLPGVPKTIPIPPEVEKKLGIR